MKKLIFGIIGVLLLLFMGSNVSALNEGRCVDVQVTDITPSSVEIGDELTVGIQLDNCGDELPENVHFEITRFSDDIIIKEPLIVEFDKPFGYSNSKRFNIYHLYVTNKATPGEYVFEYELTYGDDNSYALKEGDFSITVTS
jgi:hypothetical protein